MLTVRIFVPMGLFVKLMRLKEVVEVFLILMEVLVIRFIILVIQLI